MPRTSASTAEIVSALRVRNAELRALSAVVSMVYEGPDRSGTFEAVVLHRAPRSFRLQAFKDVLVDTRDLFDLALDPERYGIRHDLEDEPVEDRGPLARFPSAHPRFAGIYHAGEALFLPGAARADAPIQVLDHLDTGVRVETRLANGLRAQWDLHPVSLRPLRGFVFAPKRRIYLEYLDYEGRGGSLDLPEEVRFRDGPTSIQVRLSELDLAPELDDEAFRLP